MSIDVLYYVSCLVWTPGRVAAAFATANGDPNKIPNSLNNYVNKVLVFIFNTFSK